MKPPTPEDMDALGRTLWGEARGEGIDGMRCVAWVAINRANIAQAYMLKHGKEHPLFGFGGLESAVRKPFQFSCWNKNDPNFPKLMALDGNDEGFKKALTVAAQCIASAHAGGPDPTGGATHYYETHIPAPAWAAGLAPSASVGNHVFFSGVH